MFAKNGNMSTVFKLILYWQKDAFFSQIILFSKSKFTVIYICMSFIDFYKFKHSFFGG